MMLFQDGSTHAWLSQGPALDLIVTLDDATSAITSMFLCEQEGTASSFRGIAETIRARGLFSSFYTPTHRGVGKKACVRRLCGFGWPHDSRRLSQ
jgi:hypothetical protein